MQFDMFAATRRAYLADEENTDLSVYVFVCLIRTLPLGMHTPTAIFNCLNASKCQRNPYKIEKIYLAAAPDKMDLSFSMRVHRASETKQQREKPVDAAFLLLCAVR